jgi:hypothetical protein
MISLAFYRNGESKEAWSLLLYVYREIDHHVLHIRGVYKLRIRGGYAVNKI